LLYALGILAAGYGLVVALLFLGQARLVYYPEQPGRAILATPGDAGLPFRRVRPVTADGVTLDGWWVPAPGERGTVLFFHGNAGNISHRLDTLVLLHRLGLSTLIIDYRGYGRSGGRPSETGTYRDAEAAWHLLTAELGADPGRVVVFGRSLGAAVAARLAARHRPAGLVLESGFTSVPDLAAHLYPWLPARWISRFRYATEESVSRVQCPVLVVHSPEDELVPYAHGRALFEAAPGPKRFLAISGGHDAGFRQSADTYIEGWERFLDRFLPPRGEPNAGLS
jgi:hypothetical protein